MGNENVNEKTFTFDAPRYSLSVKGHLVSVIVENNVLAVLDVRTAVPQTNETDDGFLPDPEPDAPVLTKAEIGPAGAEFVWEGKSALWGKKYVLTADKLRFRYTVTVQGRGRADAVKYFLGRGFGSGYEFSEGFTPCVSWYNNEDYHFRASEKCHRWSVLMVPPMFCYSFRTERIGTRLGFGLVAEKGEHNFNSFDYKAVRNGFESGFFFETDQSGHVSVDGSWTAPAIIGYVGDSDEDICRRYSEYYFLTGIAELPRRKDRPRFWYGPMVCGWIEQMIASDNAAADKSGIPNHSDDFANEKLYDALAEKIKKYDLHPTALIIDDKWAEHYAAGEADQTKFPDMRAYVERRRKEGIRTLLWFKLWDRDGWDDSLCIENDRGEKYIDPSTEEYKALVRERMHLYLSDDEGCYNCDGFKLDFAFIIPMGRKVRARSGKYGVELLYEMMKDIYDAAKAVKPDALINCSPCHPYFASICDQARLHDYDPCNRDNRADLGQRAKMFSLAMPGVLLDTDNAGFISRRDTIHWLMDQPLIGVPDLYTLSSSAGAPFCDSDIIGLSQLWKEYGEMADRMYGKDEIK